MKYRTKCNKLYKAVNDKLSAHYHAEAEHRKFPDKQRLEKRNKTEQELKQAREEYQSFLTQLASLGKSLDDEMPLSTKSGSA